MLVSEASTEDRLKIVEHKLKDYKLEEEIRESKKIIREVLALKEEKNVIILGHNYMLPEVYYGLSDYIGDSLGLAKQAAETNADIILFNGVHFMAETAKILNPEKKVLIADLEAGCSLSESITGRDVQKLRSEYPGIPVVTYINCSAEVKANSDIICTSANALKVVESLDSDRVIMIPDQYLAENVQKQTDKKIISWSGKCMVHELFTVDDVLLTRKLYPEVKVIAHPECHTEVTQAADFSASTSQMAGFIKDSKAKKVMLLTECSMGENLKVEFPEVEFVSTCQNCPHMKKITLEKILQSLLKEIYEVNVPKKISERAYIALQRMLDIGR